MRTNQVSNTENRNFSVLKTGGIGAALGYAATYAVPLTTNEHNSYFTKSVKNSIAKKVSASRRSEISIIDKELKNGNFNPLVKDTFVKNKKALETNPGKVLETLYKNDSMEKGVKNSLTSFYKRVRNSGRITEFLENRATAFAAKKHNRVPMYWAIMGALVFMSVALMKKGLDTVLPKPEKSDAEPNKGYVMDKDLEYILNAAEVPAEIYIFGFGKDSKKAKENEKH